MALHGHTESGIRRVGLIDHVTNSVVATEIEHAETHDGHSFTAFVDKDPVAAGEYLAIGFDAPADIEGPRIHLVFGFESEAEAHVELLEEPALTPAVGGALVAFNRRRDSDHESPLVNLREYDNAGVVGGTELDRKGTWSDKKQTTIIRASEERVLAPGVSYAVWYTCPGNSGAIVRISFYYHTDRTT